MGFETFTIIMLSCLFGTFCVMLFLVKWNDKQWQREVDKHKEDKKEMVELLGRIYLDCDYYNGKIMNDTRRKLDEWVGK